MNMIPMEERPKKVLLTPEQIVEMLHLKPRKVADLLRSGEIPSVKIGNERRVDPDDLEEFIRKNKQQGKS